jgi:hypothetical protein
MGLAEAITGTLALAAVSTAGDLIWATWISSHRAVYGFIHGALLFLAIGLFLGSLAGRAAAGAIAGACVGGLAAGLYYLLAPVLGFSAMIVAWMVVWVGLAVVYGWLSAHRMDVGNRHDIRIDFAAVASRGVIAAIASGLGFYAISGIWRPFDPAGWDYAVHFAAWTLAYFPGFAALLVTRATKAMGPAKPF